MFSCFATLDQCYVAAVSWGVLKTVGNMANSCQWHSVYLSHQSRSACVRTFSDPPRLILMLAISTYKRQNRGSVDRFGGSKNAFKTRKTKERECICRCISQSPNSDLHSTFKMSCTERHELLLHYYSPKAHQQGWDTYRQKDLCGK